MREVTRLMINKYALNKLKYDFMGYTFEKTNELSFHHLIIPKKDCQKIEHSGFVEWNGAILTQDKAHEYLHRIAYYDMDKFQAITLEMIDQNLKGHLDLENIRIIHDILECFEREYLGKKTKNGVDIVKEDYLKRKILTKY